MTLQATEPHHQPGSSLSFHVSVYRSILFSALLFLHPISFGTLYLPFPWSLSTSSLFKTVVWSLWLYYLNLLRTILVSIFILVNGPYFPNFFPVWCLVMFFMKTVYLTVILYLWKSDFPLVQGLTYFCMIFEGYSSPSVSWVCSTVFTENMFLDMGGHWRLFLNLCSGSVLTEISLDTRRPKNRE